MFGQNEIVGKKYFADAKEDQLFVTSRFMTIQGEGPFRGKPAFFIRLAKCNLNCSFCDTFFDDGDWLTFNQVEEAIETAIDEFYSSKNIVRPEWTKHDETKKKKMVLVLTGGEPMLQNNINTFLVRMNQIFEHTQIESNGTQATEIPKETVLVVSPKCMMKGMKAIKYLAIRKDVLERVDCLKFVMEADPDSPYSSIPDWAFEWQNKTGRDIFISPMNIYNDVPAASKKQRQFNNKIEMDERSTVDEVISFWEPGLLNMEENQKNHEYAAKYCIENGCTFQVQIHLLASLA